MLRFCIVTGILLSSSIAFGETLADQFRDERPSGFLLEVEFGASSPPITVGSLGVSGSLWSFAPRLAIGGQIRRVGLSLQVGLSMVHLNRDDETFGDDGTGWSVHFGPGADLEVWGRRSAALFLRTAIPLSVRTSDETNRNIGFGIDFGLGGRIFIQRRLAISVILGSAVSFNFSRNELIDVVAESFVVQWTLYGALSVRFVAGS